MLHLDGKIIIYSQPSPITEAFLTTDNGST